MILAIELIPNEGPQSLLEKSQQVSQGRWHLMVVLKGKRKRPEGVRTT